MIEHCKDMYSSGQFRFTVTAEDVGAYGLDIGTDVTKLFNSIASIGDNIEISVTGFNPRWVIPNLGLLAPVLEETHMIKHVVAPVQAASDRLLTLMRRGHSSDDAARFFDVLEEHGQGIQIHTHLIIGFPGESPAEVDDTIKFMERYPRVNYYVYPYCDRRGTPSSRFLNKIPEEEIRVRYSAVCRHARSVGIAVISI